MASSTLLEYPARTATPAERLDWATERMWDHAEGTLDRAGAVLVASMLQGWSDLASESERAAYLALSGRFWNMIRSNDE